jgi:beta-glucosidase
MKQKWNLNGRPFRSRGVRSLLMRPSLVVSTASVVVFICLSPLQVTAASAAPAPSVAPAYSNSVSDVPYTLPVTNLPSTTQSPSVAADAPYTPAVLNLIAQLEPSNPPTEAELANAVSMFAGGTNTTCPGTGPVGSPTLAASATVPSIMSMCWADAQGVNLTSGANAANTALEEGNTTGPMNLMGLGATFDRTMGNAWGQTEGTEARENMITGLFGPQTDIDRLPNWGRNLTTTGADPYLSGQMVAAQINGIQGSGAMSEMKHFTAYNGQDDSVNSQLQDQALHEIYLTPYEAGFVYGGAAATMCSYQIWQDTATTLPSSEPTLASTYPVSPYGASSQQTWPLDESHYSCEQPLTLTYALRDLWGSKAMVGSDYGAAQSASGINQGEDQEMPSAVGFSATNTIGGFGPSSGDPTGDTCADASGSAEPCSTPGAVHVAGIPGPGCPATGCTLVQAVVNGTVSLSVFNQDLATQLYQEQRFGMLGCNQTPVLPICTDPGGVGGVRTGNAPLPNGPAWAATPSANLGTKTGMRRLSSASPRRAASC